MLDLLRRFLGVRPAAEQVASVLPGSPTPPAPWTRLDRRPVSPAFLDADLPADDDPWSPENYIRSLDEARIAAVRRADLLEDALSERDNEIEALKSRLSQFEDARRAEPEAPLDDRPIVGADFDRLSERLETFRDLLVNCMREVSADMARVGHAERSGSLS